MMLSTTVRSSLRVLARPPVAQAISVRFFGVGKTFEKKGTVEENRFMREQERAFFENKKAAMNAKMHATEEKEFKEKIAPAMAEAELYLKKNGVSVDHNALEAIAKWKLDL